MMQPAATGQAEQLFQQAVQSHQQGNREQAEKLYKQVIEQAPNFANAYHMLGMLYHQLERDAEGAKMVQKAIRKDGKEPAFYNTLGTIYKVMGRLKESVAEFNKAIRMAPDFAEAHHNLGNTFMDMEQFEAAEQSFRKALAIRPDYIQALNNLGNALQSQDRYAEAAKAFEKVLQMDPDFVQSYNNIAVSLKRLNQPEQAEKALKVAIQKHPTFAEAYNNYGNVLQELKRIEEAAECYRKAIEIKPDHYHSWLNLGMQLTDLGQLDEAKEAYHKVLELNPDCTEAYRFLSRMKKYTEDDREEISQLEAMLKKPGLPDKSQIQLHFALGKIYHDLKDYDRAFSHYEQGNLLFQKTRPFDQKQHASYLKAIKHTFTREFFEKRQELGSDSDSPIFIVGMPRSGTTLTEQIISSHPKVFGAGELDFFTNIINTLPARLQTRQRYPECAGALNQKTLQDIADEFMQYLRNLEPDAEYYTDKMPSNFIRLGLISLAFPKAKIINCNRDPRDSGLSIFFQHFVHGNEFAFNLEDIGFYYHCYEEIMAHWKETLTNPILDVYYEHMVEDQEAQSRRIIDFLGLEWDDRCLQFHENERAVNTASNLQVRQPIYKSSKARWKPYEKQLQPLFEALGDAIERYEERLEKA